MRLGGIDAKGYMCGGGRGSKTPDKHATNTRGKMQENEEVVAH